jgi:hypothetical protein
MNLSLTDGSYEFYDDVNNVSRMVIDSSGNVGIGVVPSAWVGTTGLQLSTGCSLNGSTVNAALGANSYYDGVNYKYITSNPSTNYYSNYANNGSHVWQIAPSGTAAATITYTNAMTLDASGNLLVGTTNTANLASATPNVVTDESFGINDGTNIAAIGVDRINFNAGQYYVLNETNDGVKLVNGATSWTTQSDENSKENIVELSSALTAVNAMRCVRYNLKSQTPDDVKIGFIAQDWQSSYPEVVATDTDGTLGMNYTETIPVLLKAIQELSAQNAALTARIAALES